MREQKTSTLNYVQLELLWRISIQPMTCSLLSKKMGVTTSCVITNIRVLRKKGLIVICGEEATTGRRAPLYRSIAKHEKPSSSLKGISSTTTIMKALISDAIKESPMTSLEISEYLDIPRGRVSGCMNYYRNGGLCSDVFRVSGWVLKDGYGPVAVYSCGPGSDILKPPYIRHEADQRWREKNRAKIRAKYHAWQNKKSGIESVCASPFGQLLQFTGATLSASKQASDARRAEKAEIA